MTSLHRLVLVGLLGSSCTAPARGQRELVVRDLQIMVPEGWGVTWDPDSTVLLFPPSDRSTSLRISGLTAVSPRPLVATAARDWLRDSRTIPAATIETFSSGASMATKDSVFTETGVLVHIRSWYLAQASLPDTLHIGIISLAQEVKGVGDSLRGSYVAAAEHLVRTATYRRH